MIISPVPWKVEVRLGPGGKLTYYKSDTEFLELDDSLETWVWDEKGAEPRQILGKVVEQPKPQTKLEQPLLW